MSKSNAFTQPLLGVDRTVQPNDFARPFYLVLDALTGRLGSRPQLQVLQAVVASVTVLVVNIFISGQRAPEVQSHYPPVFENECALDLHGVEHLYVSILDGRKSHFAVASRAGTLTAGLGHAQGSFATCTIGLTAGLAPTREVRTLSPLTNSAHRVPAALTATRAFNFKTRPGVAVHAPKLRHVANETRMRLNRGQVRWSGHTV